jgi:hypothetical protein
MTRFMRNRPVEEIAQAVSSQVMIICKPGTSIQKPYAAIGQSAA